MKKLFIIMVILLLSLLSVSAAEIETESTALIDKVEPGETARFTVNIHNNQKKDDTFMVYKDELAIFPFSDYIEDITVEPSQVHIGANKSKTIIASVKLRDDVAPNKNYKTFIRIKSIKDPEIKEKHSLTVRVVSPAKLFAIDSSLPLKIGPGKETSFVITVKNNANEILEDVDLYVSSDFFSKKYKEKFFAYQDLTKKITFTLPTSQEPGKHTLGVWIYVKGTLRGKLNKDFEVIPKKDVEENIKTVSTFLRKEIIITKSNNGNTKVTEEFEILIPSMQKISTAFNKEPVSVFDDKYRWEFNIEPNTSYQLIITTNYRLLFFGTIALILMIILFFYWMSLGVSIKKTVFKMKDNKGGISEIKVMLHVKNNTRKRLQDVKIIDLVPNIIDLSEDYGTLKPNKLQKGERFIRMTWNVDSLEMKEERVISYKVLSKLHIFGTLTLPNALLRYRDVNRKIVDVKSNKIVLKATSKEEEKK